MHEADLVYGGGLSSPPGPRESSAREGACMDAGGVLCPPRVRCVRAGVENLAGGLGMLYVYMYAFTTRMHTRIDEHRPS